MLYPPPPSLPVSLPLSHSPLSPDLSRPRFFNLLFNSLAYHVE